MKRRRSMYRHLLSTLLMVALPTLGFGQLLSDDFTDGNFSQNPTWQGTEVLFRVENGALRYQGPAATTTAYLSTAFSRNLNSTATEWRFTLTLRQSKLDRLNFIRVFLTADLPLLDATTVGYYLELGGENGSADAARPRLVLETGAGAPLVVAEATERFLDPGGTYAFRVLRTASGIWQLDVWDAELQAYRPRGIGTNPTAPLTNAFGLYSRHQSDNADGYLFDDLVVSSLPPDADPPRLLTVRTPAADTLVLVFSEGMASGTALSTSRYTVNGATPLGALYTTGNAAEVRLSLASPLVASQPFTISVAGLTDFAGNSLTTTQTFTYEPLASLVPGSAWLNEVLFDPRTDEVRYVEVAVHEQAVQLEGLRLARGTRDTVVLATLPTVATPSAPVAFCAAPDQVRSSYRAAADSRILAANLPAYSRDTDTLRLLSASGVLLDQLVYAASWHSPWLTDTRGVALERVSLAAPTQQATNWQSAASSANFGTPGSPNSVASEQPVGSGSIRLIRPDFSPDGDGTTDALEIEFDFAAPGWRAEVSLYTPQGQLVRRLPAALLPTHPVQLVWDGRSDNGTRLPPGFYVVFAEVLHPDGRQQVFKKACVLALPR